MSRALIGVPVEVLFQLARTNPTVHEGLNLWRRGHVASLEGALILIVETMNQHNEQLLAIALGKDRESPQFPDRNEIYKRWERYLQQEDRRREEADVVRANLMRTVQHEAK